MRKAKITKVCFCTTLFLLISFLLCSHAYAYSNSTPDALDDPEKWNSMRIDYSINGVAVENREVNKGTGSSQTYSVDYDGILGSGYLTVEGTAYSWYSDNLHPDRNSALDLLVIVRVGDEEERQEIRVPSLKIWPVNEPSSENFRVSVPIPSDATDGSFSIYLSNHFANNFCAHSVSGTFTREVAPGGTTSSGSYDTQSGTSGLQGGYPPADDTPWGVIIGGLSAVAAAAAVMISKARKKDAKKQTKNEKDNNEEQEGQDKLVGYILQLESFPETVSQKPGSIQVAIYDHQPHTVKVTAWQVKSQSGYQPAPHAVLQVQPPAAKAGLSVSPLNGQGSMTLSIKLTGEIKAGSFEAVVTASADGISTSAAIDITIIGFFLVVA